MPDNENQLVYRTEKIDLGFNPAADKLCWEAKNLYNQALFWIKQKFIYKDVTFQQLAQNDWENTFPHLTKFDKNDTRCWVRYGELDKMMKKYSDDESPYRKLFSQSSQHILKMVDSEMSGFFKSIKKWKANPDKFNGKPNLPRYKHIKKGRKTIKFPKNGIRVFDISDKGKKANTKIRLSTKNTLNHFFYIKSRLTAKELQNVQEVRIVPQGAGKYKAEIVYKKYIPKPNLSDKKLQDLIKGNSTLDFSECMYIDLGVNNLATILDGGGHSSPHIINGKPVKATNQYYNKQLRNLKSKMKHNYKLDKLGRKIYYKTGPNKGKPVVQSDSKTIRKLTVKRNNKIYDYFHKSSKYIVDLAVKNGNKYIIIGNNKGWKQKVNLGKKNNQNFTQIPFAKLIHLVEYKAQEQGIQVIVVEESYTSKVDHLAGETMEKHTEYKGTRKYRGLFVSSTGIHLNADVNGCIGIARKVSSESSWKKFQREVVGRGCLAQPVRQTPPLKCETCG